jgi:hypothetical protein
MGLRDPEPETLTLWILAFRSAAFAGIVYLFATEGFFVGTGTFVAVCFVTFFRWKK